MSNNVSVGASSPVLAKHLLVYTPKLMFYANFNSLAFLVAVRVHPNAVDRSGTAF
jgi:hypothetical protein